MNLFEISAWLSFSYLKQCLEVWWWYLKYFFIYEDFCQNGRNFREIFLSKIILQLNKNGRGLFFWWTRYNIKNFLNFFFYNSIFKSSFWFKSWKAQSLSESHHGQVTYYKIQIQKSTSPFFGIQLYHTSLNKVDQRNRKVWESMKVILEYPARIMG